MAGVAGKEKNSGAPSRILGRDGIVPESSGFSFLDEETGGGKARSNAAGGKTIPLRGPF